MMIDLKKKSPKRILFITMSNLGDVILSLPVACALRKSFPEAEIDIVVGVKAAGLVRNSSAFSNVFVYDKAKGLKGKAGLWLKLLRRRYDFVADLKNTMYSYLVMCPSKSLAVNSVVKSIDSRYAQAQKRIELFGLERAAPENIPLFSEKDKESLMLKLRSEGHDSLSNYLLVAPGARSDLKRWPAAHFADLIKMILDEKDMTVVLVGDTFDEKASFEVEKGLEAAKVLNLTGKISQAELAVLTARAEFVLSNDSALMHLGNYYERMTLGIFGPTDADKYGWTSKTAQYARLADRQASFDTLLPEEVFKVAKELLEENS